MASMFCFLISVAFIIACIYGIVEQSKVMKKQSAQWKQDKKNGIQRFCAVHVAGLNAVEGTDCQIKLSPSALTIACSGKEYSLPIDRIEYVEGKADIDEKIYQESSVARGVAGAALFGVSGAVIGSAPKTKTKKDIKYYAIIRYRSTRREEKVIVLKDTPHNSYMCNALVNALKPYVNSQAEKVEL